MFIRQSKDPDSMPTRRKRRMFKRERRGDEGESLATKFPKRRVLYDPQTLEGKVFNTLEEQKEALESGKWIEHPKMSFEDWMKHKLGTYYEELPEEEPHVNWAEKLKLRDSNLPVAKKYISQMNVKELIDFGKRLNLDFGTPETCPTKKEMKEQIEKAQKAIHDNN